MTDEERIRQVFQDFEDGGLVSKDIDKVLSCIADRVIGIGIGEQGFVRSKSDIQEIFASGLREDDCAAYSLQYARLDILIHDGQFANACGEVIIHRSENGNVTKSKLLQTLIFVKEGGDWKICGLHASAPAITAENMEAYPLKVAENLLQNMRKEIGEKAFMAEQQFQQAVLADTVAFYIVNFSKNCFEQCQVNQTICAYAEPGTPYEAFVREKIPEYVAEEDREKFLSKLSLGSVLDAIERNETEISCEYMLSHPGGSSFWAVTVIRLITDCITGEHKGIMYVKDIDQQKRRELEMKNKAERDDLTGIYNRTAFVHHVERLLSHRPQATGAFFMLDIDRFKEINDTFGHPFGDFVLVSVAEALKEQFQAGGILGRLGGDEFGAFVPEETAQTLAEGRVAVLMEKLRQLQAPQNISIPISCSIGIADAEGARAFAQLYQQADEAMYRSKHSGKGRCTIYTQQQ